MGNIDNDNVEQYGRLLSFFFSFVCRSNKHSIRYHKFCFLSKNALHIKGVECWMLSDLSIWESLEFPFLFYSNNIY